MLVCLQQNIAATQHGLLSIITGMMSVHIIHISNYSVMKTASNENVYLVLAKSSSYFRVWKEGADCLIVVLGPSSFE
jgi:hypothetical protein